MMFVASELAVARSETPYIYEQAHPRDAVNYFEYSAAPTPYRKFLGMGYSPRSSETQGEHGGSTTRSRELAEAKHAYLRDHVGGVGTYAQGEIAETTWYSQEGTRRASASYHESVNYSAPNQVAVTPGRGSQTSSVNYWNYPTVRYESSPRALDQHTDIGQNVHPVLYVSGQSTPAGNTTPGEVDWTTTQIGMLGRVAGSYVTGEYTATASHVSGSGIVTGEERVIGMNTIQRERVISERIVEHEVKVPKRIVREEVIEKTIVVPETIFREEVVEERHLITEKIIEVARPIVHEKIIEVPEIEYRDKIVEKVEKIQQEKIVEVPRIQYEDRVVEVPKIVYQEKIVEVPDIEYREVIVEKVIEMPEIREQIVVKEVPVPQYIEKPVQEIRDVPQPVNIERNIPVPVEAIITFEYQLAQLRPRVNKVQYPLYVPHFVEVPVSAELLDEQTVTALQTHLTKLQLLGGPHALSLCEIENLATEIRRVDTTVSQLSIDDLQSALTEAWKAGRIEIN